MQGSGVSLLTALGAVILILGIVATIVFWKRR